MAKTLADIEEVKSWTDEEITEYLYQFRGCKSFDFSGRFIQTCSCFPSCRGRAVFQNLSYST